MFSPLCGCVRPPFSARRRLRLRGWRVRSVVWLLPLGFSRSASPAAGAGACRGVCYGELGSQPGRARPPPPVQPSPEPPPTRSRRPLARPPGPLRPGPPHSPPVWRTSRPLHWAAGGQPPAGPRSGPPRGLGRPAGGGCPGGRPPYTPARPAHRAQSLSVRTRRQRGETCSMCLTLPPACAGRRPVGGTTAAKLPSEWVPQTPLTAYSAMLDF